jgi:bifunctional UDP-N-acetylglucosamine pyrophosphorylase/glucosamine-1-phosphate N-acetyltransferase
MKLEIIILAAGQGTRMKSSVPKVLHKIAGKSMLQHVVDTANTLKPDAIHIVYGHGGEQVLKENCGDNVNYVEQAERLGTGHAVDQVSPFLSHDSLVLVLYGDVPLVNTDTLAFLIANSEKGLGLLTVHLDNPKGYGRIIRDMHGSINHIVEEKDASVDQKAITEVNTGILSISAKKLKGYLSKLTNDNAQDEFYLTDIVSMAVEDKCKVTSCHPVDEYEVAGVNSPEQLASLERHYQGLQASELLARGVTLRDPGRFDLRGDIKTGKDVEIDINVIFEGNIALGDRVSIGPGCIIKNSTIASDVTIEAYSVIDNVEIGEGVAVGPFARLRPGTKLAKDSKIGNFVEIKNSEIGSGSKVNHLSYVGDTSMGSGVNVGAGSITANYDGVNKHKTRIGDNASIGSNCVMVAPVKVGSGATLGAGSILRKDAPVGELTLSNIRQITISGWKRPAKKAD